MMIDTIIGFALMAWVFVTAFMVGFCVTSRLLSFARERKGVRDQHGNQSWPLTHECQEPARKGSSKPRLSTD